MASMTFLLSFLLSVSISMCSRRRGGGGGGRALRQPDAHMSLAAASCLQLGENIAAEAEAGVSPGNGSHRLLLCLTASRAAGASASSASSSSSSSSSWQQPFGASGNRSSVGTKPLANGTLHTPLVTLLSLLVYDLVLWTIRLLRRQYGFDVSSKESLIISQSLTCWWLQFLCFQTALLFLEVFMEKKLTLTLSQSIKVSFF